MYVWFILPPASSINERDPAFNWRLIEDVVGLSTAPAAGEGILTHLLYVSLVSSQMETESRMCLFKIGQYRLALLNSPEKKPKNFFLEAF